MPKLKFIIKDYVSENTEKICIIIYTRNKIISSVVTFFLIFNECTQTQTKLKSDMGDKVI